jgi:hypothetical protein
MHGAELKPKVEFLEEGRGSLLLACREVWENRSSALMAPAGRATPRAVAPCSRFRTSRSIFSNNSRRLRPRWRMGRSFIRCMTSVMASLHSASEKKVDWRNRPRMYV